MPSVEAPSCNSPGSCSHRRHVALRCGRNLTRGFQASIHNPSGASARSAGKTPPGNARQVNPVLEAIGSLWPNPSMAWIEIGVTVDRKPAVWNSRFSVSLIEC